MPSWSGSKGQKKQTLRDLGREPPSRQDEALFLDKARQFGPDLEVAVVRAARLDYLLEDAIVSKLARQDADTLDILSMGNGPLATFFSKICLS